MATNANVLALSGLNFKVMTVILAYVTYPLTSVAEQKGGITEAGTKRKS